MEQKNLSRLFSPKSIAVYGVSQNTGKIGATIFSNLITSGFVGRVFPVNPKYKEVLGYKCYPSAESIPFKVDLAVMAIPGDFIEQVLDDCRAKKIKHLLVISSGFKEIGGKGVKLEEKLISKAEEYGITILGPNSLGLITTENKMNASFAPNFSVNGDIAFLSQSGAICSAFLDMAIDDGIGFSHIVSLGNKANLNENDLLAYWLNSKKVNVVGGYLEGFTDGLEFITMKQKLQVEKPIVILKPGISNKALKAIGSHTGAMAGEHEVIKSAAEKYGITLVEDLKELYLTLSSFSLTVQPKGPNIAVVTNAGGAGVLISDQFVGKQIKFANLSEETQQSLKEVLPKNGSVANPVDILGDADVNRYQNTLNILMEAKEVDGIILILTPQMVTQIEETARLIANLKQNITKPLIPVFLGGRYVHNGLKRLFDQKIVGFDDLGMAVRVMDYLWRYYDYRQHVGKSISEKIKPGSRKLSMTVKSSEQEIALPEDKVQQLLVEFNLPAANTFVVNNLEQGLTAAEKVEYPLILKATTEDVIHKNKFKAIYAVKDEKDFTTKITKLQEDIYHLTKRDHPNVMVQGFVDGLEELFIGVKRDGGADVYEKQGKGFGHLLLFGKGGIYTEIFDDIARSLLPLTDQQIYKMIDSTKAGEILRSKFSENRFSELRKELSEIISKLTKMVYTYPEISSMDLNPVMITKKGCVLVDVKIFVKN